MSTPLTVAVIYGGNSPEHSISCISAGSIMQHMPDYEVIPIGISKEGGWYLTEGNPPALSQQGRTLPEVTASPDAAVALSLNPATKGRFFFTSGPRAGETAAQVDVILPVLHGPNGEDGTIQGLFELAGIPYVGCGVAASANSMDKEFTKVVLGAAGLPIGQQVVLRPHESTLSDEQRTALGLPVFVKPARGGSSIGISKVTHWSDLDEAIALARTCDSKVLIEAGIVGHEIECGVLELPSGEIRASHLACISLPAADDSSPGVDEGDDDEAFYDFDTKYLDDVISVQLPADLPADVTEKVQDLAVEAFRAIDGKGLARVDFFVTADGPIVNEINTFPGFTSISMYPQMWGSSGVNYEELIRTLITTELERH